MAERGFIPPAARRKLEARREKMRKERRSTCIRFGVVSAFGFLFVLVNVQYIRSIRSSNKGAQIPKRGAKIGVGQMLSESNKLRGGKSWISVDTQPFNQDHKADKTHHLILVAGHSVTISGDLQDAGSDEADWFLLDYQKGQGLPQAIIAHIQAGIGEASLDPDSLLVFSGGETRALTGPLTEGSSYFNVADAMDMWPSGSTVRARTVTEEFATDSFENLMFSICRFKEVTGNYPTKITVVSFSFKRRRFETLHAPALGWRADRFFYIGVDPPASTGFNLQRASDGEQKNAASLYETDPYGCNSPVLQQKRRERNPYARIAPYPLSCPEIKDLLSYCGPGFFPRDRLPWGN